MNHASREAEHRAFLRWLEATIVARSVEVLLVAGDVFETMHPSAEALELYYGFLARVRDAPSLRQIVVVGGNHDSPSRLDAPEAVLGALGVHVVGGWSVTTVARSACPIRGASGDVELVVGAIPFVHEYRLGVRTAGRMPGDIELDLRREFARLYSKVADACEAVADGAPLLAMGHLTCSSADATDYRSAIHQAARIGGFSPEIFDPRFRYVALGHIHRMMQVSAGGAKEPAVWYSGSAIALNRKEAASPRHVLLLDVERSGEIRVEPLEVPPVRDVTVLDGELDEVLAQLRGLSWENELVPYVLATVHSEERLSNVGRRFDELLGTFPEERRPRLVHLRERVRREGRTRSAREREDEKSLAELDPEQVFVRLYQAMREAPVTQELLTAFRSLLVIDEDQPGPAETPDEQGDLGLGGTS